MANVKISDLTAAAAAAGANELEINEAGVSKKLTVTQLNTFHKANITAGDVGAYTTGQTDSGFVSQDSETGAADMPAGTTAQRPGSPINGYLRYNTTDDSFEGYIAGAWGAIGGGGGGAVGGGSDEIFWENDQNVTTDYTITASHNAMSAGPITINNGITVTVPNGSTWTVV